MRWVIGNWKQNKLRFEARELAEAVAQGRASAVGAAEDRVRVGIAPTFLCLDLAVPFAPPGDALWLFAQNVGAQDFGAFTGEIGPTMLLDAGVNGAIIGHSERREHFWETDEDIERKLRCALAAGLQVVLCIGEPLEIREAEQHETFVISQLSTAFFNIPPEHITERLVLAYEPIWAIGTGKTATPAEASAMHHAIRTWMGETFGANGRDRSILYGGSVKPANAAALLAAPDIDGFLVGGASLDAASFLDIVRTAAGG
ncbi:MAG: triose-phosphate isomerase [Myxococcales bacterium]|nr:triose-phosphate isomerase [Myxococcales bacterium]